jgi:hypothetical protein
MSCRQCCEWFKHFKESRTSVSEDPRPGRLSKSTEDYHAEKVCEMIYGNHHLAVRKVAEDVGIIAMQF